MQGSETLHTYHTANAYVQRSTFISLAVNEPRPIRPLNVSYIHTGAGPSRPLFPTSSPPSYMTDADTFCCR